MYVYFLVYRFWYRVLRIGIEVGVKGSGSLERVVYGFGVEVGYKRFFRGYDIILVWGVLKYKECIDFEI